MASENQTDKVSNPTDKRTTAPTADADLSTAHRRWWWPTLIILIIASAVGIYWHRSHSASSLTSMVSRHGRHGPHGMGDRPVPVQAAAVKRGDLNIFIDGLGTVTAANTATVKSRVDGQLLSYHAQDGQMVHAGDLLAEIDPRPYQVQLAQAEGQLAKDTAALKNAQLDLVRYQTLWTQDSIARQQVDTQAALVRQDQGTIKADQAAVASARLNLTYSRITAPISGRLGLRQVDLGNIVHASDANGIVTITQLQPIFVLFTIPEDQISSIARSVQSGISLPVDAYDRDQKSKIATGKLLTVDNQIDPSTGTVKLKAVFTNTDGALFPNQFVNVHMLTSTMHNAILVPSTAIQRGNQGTIVFVVKSNQTVSLQRIQAGPSEGSNTSVITGLKPGERVVVDGLDKLRDGARVQVIVPGAAAASGQGSQSGLHPHAHGEHHRRGTQ